jgi:hypothetical protein
MSDELKDRVRKLGESLGVPMDDVLGALDGAMFGAVRHAAEEYCDGPGRSGGEEINPDHLVLMIETEDGGVPVLEIEADGGYIFLKTKTPLRKA